MDEPNCDALLRDLNDAQRRAVTHGDGPLLIVAGAGTGKTTTLARRVAWLIGHGAEPSRVLLLTFTRRAAMEMLRRADAYLSAAGHASAAAAVWGGTFHAVAVRLLRRYGNSIGLPPNFTILDRSDAEDLLGAVRADLGLADSKNRFPSKSLCAEIYGRVVNSQQPLDEVLEEHFPAQREQLLDLKALFKGYTARKEAEHLLDYDDLLLFWNVLLADSAAGDGLRKLFTHVLVDEYQDTNRLQAAILKQLRPDGTGVTVVGDDAQAIYAFRAATVRNILDFPQDFPDTSIVPLEENYRSTQPILNVANAVIAAASERHEKTLRAMRAGGVKPTLIRCDDEGDQARHVVDSIEKMHREGLPLRKQSVLFRAAHHSLALEVELNRREIPFVKYGGLKFLETAHVKDLLAFLRFIENPRDSLAADRMLSLLPGIGRKTSQLLFERLRQSGFTWSVAWSDYQPGATARENWRELMLLLRDLDQRESRVPPPAEQVRSIRRFYLPLLEARYDHPAVRVRDLEQIELLAAGYPDRASFLSDLTLDPPSSTRRQPDEPNDDDDVLVLSTIHSAKGLEFAAVHVLNAVEGAIPPAFSGNSQESLDEERRLFYVALTRAKDWLYLYHPLRFSLARGWGGAYGLAPLTPFLTPEIQQLLEVISVGGEPAPALMTGDVRRRIGQMWD